MLVGIDKRLASRWLSILVVGTLAVGIVAAVGGLREHTSSGGDRVAALRGVTRYLSGYPAMFLSMYMDPDGRIVRRDQGGDTVSEGQAYGMLIAAASGDRNHFDLIWSWTRKHLSRPDGLLAWHWRDERVVDQMPASDADIDAAWALALAASRFSLPDLATEARRIAASVIEEETYETRTGLVLVAGPWAVPSETIEPGYFAPEAFGALGRITGDRRWSQIETTAGQILQGATAGHRLPPEWMSAISPGRLGPIGSPSQTAQPPTYQVGAARVAAWWAASCSSALRGIAAGEWGALATTARTGAFDVSLSLSGEPQTAGINPMMAVTDGMAAAAAGHRAEAASLLESGAQLDRRIPTYYGAAWIALGYLLATTHQLNNCPPL